MIVSCPSCDSKYQVADEKVAGAMLRTRCKACGAQIVLDGTNPPPAGSAPHSDGARGVHDEHPPRLSEVPARGKSKPPPPQRSTAPAATGTAKPPPPARTRPPTGSHPIHSDRPDTATKAPVNSEDVLDPNASSSDFYAKLLSKVGSPRSVSQPAPAGSTSAHPATHEPFAPAADHEAPPGDFYAKILAKVKPKSEPPAGAPHASEHNSQPLATSEPDAPHEATLSPAHGLGDFEVHVELPGDAARREPTAQAAENMLQAAPAAQLASASPPHNEAPIAPSIQLPPINNGLLTDSRQPPPVNTAASLTPPQDPVQPSKPEATLEPSIKSTNAASSQSPVEFYARPQKRVAGLIAAVLGVGLLGVGGGVAATIYALRPSLNTSRVGATSTAATAPLLATAAPSSAPAQPAQSVAAPTTTQAQPAEPAEPEKHAAKSSSKSLRSAPVAAAEPRKTSNTDSNVPTSLEGKSAGKTNTATGLPPTPAQSPSKVSGSGPFQKDVATAMLGVAASQAATCKKPGGPTGTGKAIVTFETNGQVVVTNIIGEGFPGTPTGQCVAGLFRRVRVPPFSGDRATAAKIFVIPP